MEKYTKYFIFFISGLTFFRMIYIVFLPIIPQEAYYWYYAQYPALSYFDHPPMAAYSIWLGTNIFGNISFGVKFMAVIWSMLTNIILFKTVLRALDGKPDCSKLAFVSVILFNLTIFAHFYSILMVPDNPLIFFWLLSIYFFQEILLTEMKYYWLLTGMSLGLGFISKYTIVALLPAFLFILIFKKEWRFWFKSPYPYLGLLVMVLTITPIIAWNYQHNWVSFGFQFSGRAQDLREFQSKYILQLFASQLLMLTPLGFVLFARLGFNMKTIWKNHSIILFFVLSGIFLIGGFVIISLRSLVKMNWLLPGYMGIIIAITLYFRDGLNLKSRWMKNGAIFSLFLILTAHLVQIIPNVPLGEGNIWSGWSDASTKIFNLQKNLGGTEKCFIFSNSYKSASMLKFYLPDHQDTYAQNIYNKPALQFDIWGIPKSLVGKNALFVFTDRREYSKSINNIRPFFEKIELVQEFNYTFINDIHVRTIYCYYAQNYQPNKKIIPGSSVQ